MVICRRDGWRRNETKWTKAIVRARGVEANYCLVLLMPPPAATVEKNARELAKKSVAAPKTMDIRLRTRGSIWGLLIEDWRRPRLSVGANEDETQSRSADVPMLTPSTSTTEAYTFWRSFQLIKKGKRNASAIGHLNTPIGVTDFHSRAKCTPEVYWPNATPVTTSHGHSNWALHHRMMIRCNFVSNWSTQIGSQDWKSPIRGRESFDYSRICYNEFECKRKIDF